MKRNAISVAVIGLLLSQQVCWAQEDVLRPIAMKEKRGVTPETILVTIDELRDDDTAAVIYGISAKQMAKKLGTSVAKAKRELQKMVDAGQLVSYSYSTDRMTRSDSRLLLKLQQMEVRNEEELTRKMDELNKLSRKYGAENFVFTMPETAARPFSADRAAAIAHDDDRLRQYAAYICLFFGDGINYTLQRALGQLFAMYSFSSADVEKFGAIMRELEEIGTLVSALKKGKYYKAVAEARNNKIDELDTETARSHIVVTCRKMRRTITMIQDLSKTAVPQLSDPDPNAIEARYYYSEGIATGLAHLAYVYDLYSAIAKVILEERKAGMSISRPSSASLSAI